MLDDGQPEQGGQQDPAGAQGHQAGLDFPDQPQPGAAGQADRHKKEGAHRPATEITGQVHQVARQVLLTDLRHTEVKIHLGGKTHAPQQSKSANGHMVGLACLQQHQQYKVQQQGQLMVNQHLHRLGKAPQALHARLQRAFARAGQPAG